MNWTSWAAIAEIVGAVAVVITLLYVAKEIRQNSKSLGITALRDTTAQWNEWSNMLAGSADLADIVVRGNQARESLSDADALRYDAYLQCFFDIVESYRSLVLDYEVEKDIHVLQAIVARRISIPGYAAWLAEHAADYDDEFVEWIEAQRPGA